MATQTSRKRKHEDTTTVVTKYARLDISRRYPRLRSETVPELIDWKNTNRSTEAITEDDLQKLCSLAEEDFEELCARHPKYKTLRDNKMAVCLCQGAALHFVDRRVGVRDFDVYTFYSDQAPVKWPYRRRTVKDFGSKKFGKTLPKPGAKVTHGRFIGRNVDIMARQIPDTGDYRESIQKWLDAASTPTSYYLSQKAVVVLWPPEDRGAVLWGPV